VGPRTPNARGHEGLAPTDSRYVDVEALPWEPFGEGGIERKVLVEDPDRGVQTAMFRLPPGAVIPAHEHTDLEQTYVLEGSLEDDLGGAVTAGNYVWRPPGSSHTARAPEGALFVSVFMAPNRFFDREG